MGYFPLKKRNFGFGKKGLAGFVDPCILRLRIGEMRCTGYFFVLKSSKKGLSRTPFSFLKLLEIKIW
jgi:hypothetical protein